MTRLELALVLAVALTAMGVTSVLLTSDLVRRIVALKVASGGVMMLLLGLAYRAEPTAPDPVPHALVLTGIVIMVAVTGLGLGLVRRVEATEDHHAKGGRGPEDTPRRHVREPETPVGRGDSPGQGVDQAEWP
jgi:multicomponent Na+:H+ antiporter subunit C